VTVSQTFTVNAVVPVAPTIDTASGGNAQATVNFPPPVSDGGSAITGYTVTSIPAGGTDSNAGTLGLSHTIVGLSNGISYTFTVKAINAIGSSVPSGSSIAVVPAAPVAAAQTITFAPPSSQSFGTTLNITASSDSGLLVSLTSPTSGVCSVTGGVVTFLTTGSCTINANQAGNSNYSAATQVSNTFAVNAGVPDAPASVTAMGGNVTASVTFTAPASNGAPITGYTVTSSPAGGTDTNAGTTGLTHAITGLTNGISYTFTVKATNSVGTSATSTASNTVVPIILPVSTLSPLAGTYKVAAPLAVTVSTTSGGVIYYSTNGTTPTTVYSGPVALTGNVVLKYRTIAYGITEAIKSAAYSVTVTK
jgi:hypothetical protein